MFGLVLLDDIFEVFIEFEVREAGPCIPDIPLSTALFMPIITLEYSHSYKIENLPNSPKHEHSAQYFLYLRTICAKCSFASITVVQSTQNRLIQSTGVISMDRFAARLCSLHR